MKMPKQRANRADNEATRKAKGDAKRKVETRPIAPKDNNNSRTVEPKKLPVRTNSRTECIVPMPINTGIIPLREEAWTTRKTYAEVVAEVDTTLSSTKVEPERPLSAPPSQSELDQWEMVAEACAGVLQKLEMRENSSGDTGAAQDGAEDYEFEDWLLCHVPRTEKNEWESDEEDYVYVTDKYTQCYFVPHKA